METITFEITSVSPLLMNNPAAMKPGDGNVGVKHIPKPEEEAASKAYRLPSGQLYLPTTQFRGSILNAAVGQKIGKRAARAVFAAAMFVDKEVCELYDPETGDPLKDYVVDVQRAVIESGRKKNSIMRARPKLPRWMTTITFLRDPEWLSIENMEKVFTQAGQLIGVGDFRPQCLGPYGRYSIKLIS